MKTGDYEDILTHIRNALSMADIDVVLERIKIQYGLAGIAYCGSSFGQNQDLQTLFISTCTIRSAEQHIMPQIYWDDPVLQQSFESFLPLDWLAIENKNSKIIDHFGYKFEDYPLLQGMSFCLHGCGTEKGALFVTSYCEYSFWISISQKMASHFQLICYYLHDRIQKIKKTSFPKITLTKRENECLYWASLGKTAGETACILNISERTVRFHLNTAKEKLDATNITQATSTAIKQNLFSNSW